MTPKQQRFVQEYLTDLNATQAAIRAGYSAATAAEIGRQNLGKLEVAEAIAASQTSRAERMEITADHVARAFARVGTSDVRKLFTEDGALKPIHELDDDTAAAISSIEVVTKVLPRSGDAPVQIEYVHKIRTYDKVTALTQLARHLGMFQDKLAIEGKLSLEALVLGALAREEAEKGDHQP
jgi:phage terminase small subunit